MFTNVNMSEHLFHSLSPRITSHCIVSLYFSSLPMHNISKCTATERKRKKKKQKTMNKYKNNEKEQKREKEDKEKRKERNVRSREVAYSKCQSENGNVN